MIYYFLTEGGIVMANIKIKRINHAIQEELMNILFKEAKDELLKSVTITDCEVSSDLGYCKVYVTVLNEEDKTTTLKALNDAKSFLRGELSKRIDIRHTPELTFIYDDSITYGSRIDKVLEELEDSKNELSDTNK
ncbi:30S ribosome-binding factor RbfA [bacterium]|nr:30S ribosome-binding factor RbfA [bacterium]